MGRATGTNRQPSGSRNHYVINKAEVSDDKYGTWP